MSPRELSGMHRAAVMASSATSVVRARWGENMTGMVIHRKASLALVMLVLGIALAGCGGKKAPATLASAALEEDFQITLLDASGAALPDSSRISLEVSLQAGCARATAVLREDGLPLGADLYAELSYPSWMHPVGLSVGKAFGGEERSISVAVLDQRPLPVGVSLVGAYRSEVVTAGELFTVGFAAGASSSRSTSGPPIGGYNVLHDRDIAIVVDGLSVDFEWKEKNRGDYNRDGVVGIDDITPIAIHFGKVTNDDPTWWTWLTAAKTARSTSLTSRQSR